MSRRTAEEDVLQEMCATLNDTISKQSSPERFGSVMSSAGFIPQETLEDITSIGKISKYDKVSKIMSAVKNNITTPRGVDQFILLLYDKLRLDNLAQQLVEKLKGRKPGYQSPLLKGASGGSCVSSAESLEEKATSDHTPSPSATSDLSPPPPEKHEFPAWLVPVGVVAIAMTCSFVLPLLFHLLHNQEPKEPHAQQAILDCHELRESDLLELEGYLHVDVSLEKLCFSLSLENCYVLKSRGELDHFKLAQIYLVQKPEACWEDIVSVLCLLKQNLQAVEVCKKHNVNFTNTKHCSVKPGVD